MRLWRVVKRVVRGGAIIKSYEFYSDNTTDYDIRQYYKGLDVEVMECERIA